MNPIFEQALKQFNEEYFCPLGISKPDVLFEEIPVDDQILRLAGVFLKQDGRVIAGSSAGLGSSEQHIRTAFFEFLERWLVFQTGEFQEQREGDLFWKFSLSNGVALHTDLSEARSRAALELSERDQILRSWYGFTKLQRVAVNRESLGHFEFESYMIPPLEQEEAVVSFTLARSMNLKFPSHFGFGAGQNLERSLQKSYEECVQRLAFLWNEPFVDGFEFQNASPADHQEFFMTKKGQEAVEKWIKGENPKIALKETHLSEIEFDDLTPQQLSGRLFVVRAKRKSAVPLVFGNWNPALSQKSPAPIHPIS